MSDDYAFIIDTNFCRNPAFNDYFGNKDIILELSNYGTIIIPKIVMLEIENQKKIAFEKTKKEACVIDDIITKLRENVKFHFKTINMTEDLYEKVLQMAFNQEKPFNKDSAKGFRDSCIFISAIHYKEINEGINIVFFTKDKDLTKALEKKQFKVFNKSFNIPNIEDEFLSDITERRIDI